MGELVLLLFPSIQRQAVMLFPNILSSKENALLFTGCRSVWKHFMTAFLQWSKALGSFWGMWFSFSLISCLRILHGSSKGYVFPYTIMSYSYCSQRDLSFPNRKNKIKASEESLPGKMVCVTALTSWAKLAAASSSPAASQQKKVQHTTPLIQGKQRDRGPQKIISPSLIHILKDSNEKTL